MAAITADSWKPRSASIPMVQTLADPCDGGEDVDISSADHTFTKPVLCIYVGTAGDIKVDTWDGSTLTFTNVPVGILPVKSQKVYKVGTAAAGMIGLW